MTYRTNVELMADNFATRVKADSVATDKRTGCQRIVIKEGVWDE